jgi:hypothetical protein
MKSSLPASPAAHACVTFLLVSLTVLPSSALASWPSDPNNSGRALCTATDVQTAPKAIPDGAGGVIVAWQDNRSGNQDVYVQRMDAAGVPQWTANGVALCTATNIQSSPRIVSDGAGGAIVTWNDVRSGTYDIYARRVNSAGVPQWTANGVAICTATGTQLGPSIVPDNSGGAIIAWQDQRGGAYDIYVQRVNASGTVQWAANGISVCNVVGDQRSVLAVADGSNGAFLAWTDTRAGNDDVYAQRVNSAGAPQWTTNGVAVCTATNGQFMGDLASDDGTGAIVVWQDFRSGVDYDLYAQRLTALGTPQWGTNGTEVSAAVGAQSLPRLIPDGSGGAIIGWNDERGGSSYDVYAQRMSAAGVPQWTADGVAISTATYYQYEPNIVSDGAGGAILSWQDARTFTNDDVYAQRVSGTGSVQWTANGVAVCTAVDDQYAPSIVADTKGGAIIAFTDSRSGVDSDIYAQRIERFGRLGNPEPVITSVKDVRNDQGGVVKVSWAASYLDADPVYGVVDYRLWRSLPAAALSTRQAALRRGITADADEAAAAGKLLVLPFTAQDYAWEVVGTQSAAILPSYSYAAATLGDSVPGSYPRTAFMVEARQSTSISADRWFSAPDSGYSVDNLAPAAPAPLTGFYSGGSTRLAWNPNHEADLAGYRVYRGASVAFVPGPANLVGAQPDTGLVDPAGAPYVYKVTAVDVHGNESPVATLLPSGTLDVREAPPVRLALSLAGPNPARGASVLRFTLPHTGPVNLALYDAGGRRVRSLASGTLAAGEQLVRWDGRDDSGHEAPAGLYFARLEAGSETRQLRLALTR